jgi:hypothetical protein
MTTVPTHVEAPNGQWIDEEVNIRRHRINWFGTWNIRLDPSSETSYQQQLVSQEDALRHPYGNALLTQKYYGELVGALRNIEAAGGREAANIASIQRDTGIKDLYNKSKRHVVKNVGETGTRGEVGYQQGTPTLYHVIRKGNQEIHLQILHSGNVFEFLYAVHSLAGHPGWQTAVKRHKSDGHYVTKQMLLNFKSSCPTCALNASSQGRVPSVGARRPIDSNFFRDRIQADLVKMKHPQENASGHLMQYILSVKDHFTGLIYLEAIEKKRPEIVAEVLARIFALIGYPLTFHSDNGGEFIGDSLINAIKEYFPLCAMVTGRRRVPWHQGSVENANKRIRQALRTLNNEAIALGRDPETNWVNYYQELSCWSIAIAAVQTKHPMSLCSLANFIVFLNPITLLTTQTSQQQIMLLDYEICCKMKSLMTVSAI